LIFLGTAGGNVRAASPEKVVLIIAIGDSTTAGTPFFKSPSKCPPGQAIRRAIQLWNDETAAAMGGPGFGRRRDTTSQIRARFLTRSSAGAVTSSFGRRNDIYQGLPVKPLTGQSVLGCIKRLRERPSADAATILPLISATPEQAKEIDAVNGWIKKASDKLRIPLADLKWRLSAAPTILTN